MISTKDVEIQALKQAKDAEDAELWVLIAQAGLRIAELERRLECQHGRGDADVERVTVCPE